MTMSSGRLGVDFPLVGKPFANTELDTQAYSFATFLNDGRLAAFYVSVDDQTGGDDLRYLVTDTGVTTFGNYVVVDSNGTYSYEYIDGVVQSITSNILLATQYGTDALMMYRVSPAGVKLGSTQIAVTGLLGVTVAKTDTGYAAIYLKLVGAVYSFNLITSSDFITWSAPTVLSIVNGSLYFDDSVPIKHPKLYRLADTTYILVFSYASLVDDDSIIYNLGYSTSADLSIWADMLPITANQDIYKDYVFPDLIQRNDGSIFLVAEEDNIYLQMDNTVFGWDGNRLFTPSNIFVDDAGGKLYITATVQIDLATWTIDKMFNDVTTPPVPPIFFSGALLVPPDACLNAVDYACSFVDGRLIACVAKFSTDTITGYYFEDYSVEFGSSAAQNVTHDIYGTEFHNGWGGWAVRNTAIIDDKLYIAFHNTHIYSSHQVLIGYLDLTDAVAPFLFTIVGAYGGQGEEEDSIKIIYPRVKFYPDDDVAIISSSWSGVHPLLSVQFCTMSLSTGGVISYNRPSYINFPYLGFSEAVYIDGIVYGVTSYDSTLFDEANKWGLCELDTADGHTEYHYPPWETAPGNTMWDMVVNEATYEIMIRTTHGVNIFNYVAKTWTRVDNEILDEMPPDSSIRAVAYSPTLDVFFYGDNNALYYVPRSGSIQKVKYMIGTFGVSEWGFEAAELLAIGNFNQNPCVIKRSDGLLYFTWTNVSGSYDTIYWDRQEAFITLDDYIVGEITTHFNAEGDPNKLKFTVSHGHLFDPHNDNSLLRPFVEKGKQIQLQYGETVDDVNYWAYQGLFTITGQRVSYERDVYPIMEITAEDIRSLWAINQVASANLTLRSPEEGLVDILTEETELAAEDITVPGMPLSFEFDAQWINAYLQDIIDDISHRFQHFCIIDMQGQVVFRPFNFDASSVNNHYPAQTIRFELDDSYSDLTNRYTVTGQSQYDFQTLYEEERVGSLNGTVGWYGFKKDFTIYYSEDKSRRCQYPRLEIIETSTSILFKLTGGITERLIDEDPDAKSCVIEVKCANLIPVLAAAIIIYMIGVFIGDWWGIPMTKPFGRIIESIGLYAATMVLGSIGNFQYAVHAQPVGYLKREYIASANDVELQQESHQITEQKIEGFVCYTTGHCQDVADFELEVARAQRSRVILEKIAHLQDEVGDVITVTHPHTGLTKRIFIADLTRRYKASSGIDNGYFKDEIEGWVVG